MPDNDSSAAVPDPLTNAFVSVLMPCRNAGPYLRGALESVLNQPECFELLVADGGSTDGSLQVLEDLAAADLTQGQQTPSTKLFVQPAAF